MKPFFQIGRSMIEMLAVLAIIGVLSIAGILGYKLALNSFIANDILNDVRLAAATVLHQDQRKIENQKLIDISEFHQTIKFDMEAFQDDWEIFSIRVYDVPKGVCRSVLRKITDEYKIRVGEEGPIYIDDISICDQELNEMLFYFGDAGYICSTPCEDGEIGCCNGCKCDDGADCVSDEVSGEQMCCPSEQMACNGRCYTACGQGMQFDPTTCTCVCGTDSSGRPLFQDADGKCTRCPDIGGAMQLLLKNGTCECEKPGYVYIESAGECQKISCDPQEGAGGYKCTINGILCGVGCDENAKSCNGICWPNGCPDKTTFNRMPNAHRGFGQEFHCQKNKNDSCYYDYDIGEWSVNKYLGKERTDFRCCQADSNCNCQSGLCDQSYCAARWPGRASYEVIYYREGRGGCYFAEEHVFCYPTESNLNGNWHCFITSGLKTGEQKTCDTTCSAADMPSCNAKCDPDALCNVYNMGMHADSNGYCCTTINGRNICAKGTYFYIKTSDLKYNRCGVDCSADGTCELGDCSGQCPNGEYTELDNVYGCAHGRIGCYYNGNYMAGREGFSYDCTVDKTTPCGSKCDIDGNLCEIVKDLACAPDFIGACTDANGNTVDCKKCQDTKGNEVVCKQCVADQPVTKECICPAHTETAEGQLCCLKTHQLVNGGCNLLSGS